MKRLIATISSCFGIVILTTFTLLSCGGGGGGGGGGQLYSNATLTGIWLMKITSPVIVYNSFKFDGAGNMVEDYDLNPGALPAPYIVAPNGSFTFTLPFSNDPDVIVSGMLTSATEGSIGDGNPVTGTLKKVTDLGLCQGTWSGTLAGGFSQSFTIIVDSTGTIIGGTGYAGPVGGKLFCVTSDSSGLLTTGEANALSRIKFYTGTISSGATVTISGDYETNGPGGTYVLIK